MNSSFYQIQNLKNHLIEQSGNLTTITKHLPTPPHMYASHSHTSSALCHLPFIKNIIAVLAQ